jgi:hypothetical protein
VKKELSGKKRAVAKTRAVALAEEGIVQVLPEGQYIKHSVYGVGIVTEADSERTSIHFQTHGPKKFVTAIMTAEIMGDAPSKPIKIRKRARKTVKR